MGENIRGGPGDSFPDSLWVLERRYNEVEDWINDAYGEEGMPFDNFCDWVRFDSVNFIAEFPSAWESLYEQGLLDAEDAINMDRFDGDEDQLIELATDANPKFGEEIRQKLIEEGRLEESYRPRRRGQRRIIESRKARNRRLYESTSIFRKEVQIGSWEFSFTAKEGSTEYFFTKESSTEYFGPKGAPSPFIQVTGQLEDFGVKVNVPLPAKIDSSFDETCKIFTEELISLLRQEDNKRRGLTTDDIARLLRNKYNAEKVREWGIPGID